MGMTHWVYPRKFIQSANHRRVIMPQYIQLYQSIVQGVKVEMRGDGFAVHLVGRPLQWRISKISDPPAQRSVPGCCPVVRFTLVMPFTKISTWPGCIFPPFPPYICAHIHKRSCLQYRLQCRRGKHFLPEHFQ